MGSTSERPNPTSAADEDSSGIELQVPDSCISPSVRTVEVESGLESGEFPLDIVIGILSRLPVKPLFRFKSVCTNWDAMINPTNPYLVSTHRRNYTKASFFCSYLENDKHSKYTRRSASLYADGQRPMNLDKTFLESVICCTDNGVFLLGNPDYRLWNPATRETKLLPALPRTTTTSVLQPPPGRLLHCSNYGGIGVDLVANDIKVVLIRDVRYYGVNNGTVISSPVFVYTLRSNCWRELPVYYSYREGPQGGESDDKFDCPTYLKGFFYWIFRGDRNNRENVVAFDMGRVFHKIGYPDLLATEKCNIGVYRDSIALFEELWMVTDSSVDVWLLMSNDSNGGQWCWIKHSIFGYFPKIVFVKGFPKDDQIIGTDPSENKLILFDIRSGKLEVLADNCISVSRCHIYKESLVSIK